MRGRVCVWKRSEKERVTFGWWVKRERKEERKWLWISKRTLGSLNTGLETHRLMLTLTHKCTHTHTSTHTHGSVQLLLRITAQPRTSRLFYNTQAALHFSSPFSYPILLLLQYLTFLCNFLLPPLSCNPKESFGPSHQSPQVHTLHQRCPGEIKIPPDRWTVSTSSTHPCNIKSVWKMNYYNAIRYYTTFFY